MNMCRPVYRTAVVIALSAFATAPALAQDSGFYLGVDLGQSKYDIKEDLQVFPVTSGPQVDETDTGFSVEFGYRINKYVAVELSLSDYGEFAVQEYGQTTVTIAGTTTPTRPALGFSEIRGGAEGIELAAVGTLPLNKFELNGKVGAIRAKTTLELSRYTTSADSATTCTNTATVTCTWALRDTGNFADSTTSTEFFYAIGAGYNFHDGLVLKVDWTRISKLGDDNAYGEADLDFLSVGFQYRFD